VNAKVIVEPLFFDAENSDFLIRLECSMVLCGSAILALDKLKAAGCRFHKVPFSIPSFLLPVLGADQEV